MDPKLRFVMITNAVGFIPLQITSLCSTIVEIPRPPKCKYTTLLKCVPPTGGYICNIKYPESNSPHIHICNTVIDYMVDIAHFDYLVFRNLLYELLVYNMDIHECIWYILKTLLANNIIAPQHTGEIITETIDILSKYNNNYHNIYHIECYCCYLVSTIHQLK